MYEMMMVCVEDLLATFLEVDNIKQHYKSRLVGSVLNGYLSLRKLVIQRSKMIDDTQDKLLELLEEMTTGEVKRTGCNITLFLNRIFLASSFFMKVLHRVHYSLVFSLLGSQSRGQRLKSQQGQKDVLKFLFQFAPSPLQHTRP